MAQLTHQPTGPKDRIIALDFLRGFALLGILLVNVQSFAMPFAAYFNREAYGDLTGINLAVWTFTHLFADNKFMTIFSMLYGAGIILLTQKIDENGGRPAGLHYRRTFWLLVIGFTHAYLLWYGDILVAYSLIALVAFFFRKLSPSWLIVWGIGALLIGSLITYWVGENYPFFHPQIQADFISAWSPSDAALAEEIAIYQGGWLRQMDHRVPESAEIQTTAFLFWSFWRAGGLMLIGMALFKIGVLTGQRSNRFYRNMLIIGFGVGFPLVIYGIVSNTNSGWSLEYARFTGSLFNYWGSLGVSLGYIAIVMLISNKRLLQPLVDRLAAIGRTALSNYLLQTLLATFIFYGFGLGLFGQVERLGQLLIVLGIWTIQLIVSPIWLRYFRFGPAEWLWRSLTYRNFQPMTAQPVHSNA